MTQQEITLFIIKLALSGVAAFLAIALWSKTREAAWMSMVAGAVTGYASMVYDLLLRLGFLHTDGVQVAGIPLVTLLFTVVPSFFFILAFILMLLRKQ
ncbi:MAG: hypothetical protein K6G80_08625 [Treponema sp.]|nr:hypothetical protein [Treponema sp.]